jgi:hypothetical protein
MLRRRIVVQSSVPSYRLPIDVLGRDDRRGVPDPSTLTASVDEYVRMRLDAIAAGDIAGRARACWGLVARGEASLPWCRQVLHDEVPHGPGDADAEDLDEEVEDDIADAVGIAGHIGVPADWVPWIEEMATAAPEHASDLLTLLLPPAAAARAAGDGPAEPVAPATDGVLLGGRFPRSTATIWFIRAPLDRVQRAWVKQRRRKLRRKFPRLWTEHTGSLEQLLGLLEQSTPPGTRTLLVETDGEWTAVFSPGADSHGSSRLAGALGTMVIRTNWRAHVVVGGEIVQHGDCALWTWQSDGRHGTVSGRSIQASRQESRWVWNALREPFPFEDLSRYERRLVRDRFDLGLLNEYCRQLGIRRDDPAFYGPRAWLELRPRPG